MPGPWEDFAPARAAASGGPWEEFAQATPEQTDPLKRNITRAEDLPSDEHFQAAHDAHVKAALADPTGIIGTTLLGMPGGIQKPSPAVHGEPTPRPNVSKLRAEEEQRAAKRFDDALSTPLVPVTKVTDALARGQKPGDIPLPAEAQGMGLSPEQEQSLQSGLAEQQKVVGGVVQGIGQTAEGLTTPANVALLAGTEGLGTLAKSAVGVTKYLPRALSAVFTGQMLKGAYDGIPAVRDAIDKKDYAAAAKAITNVAMAGGFAGLALMHATGVHGAAPETKPLENVSRENVTTQPVEPIEAPKPVEPPSTSLPTASGGLTPEQEGHLADINKILAPIEQQEDAPPPTQAGPIAIPQPQAAAPPPAQPIGEPAMAEPDRLDTIAPQTPPKVAEPGLAEAQPLAPPAAAEAATVQNSPSIEEPKPEVRFPQTEADGPWNDFASPHETEAETNGEPWKDFQPQPVNTEEKQVPGNIRQMSPHDVNLDPARFQFKQQGVGRKGVTDQFKDVRKWDAAKAGLLQVWQDPENGKTYAVNAHHRTELAQRLDPPEGVTVQYLEAKDANDARTQGAMLNLAEGHGDPIDLAKVMRETGKTSGNLEDEGISLKGEKVRQAVALSNLDPGLFRRVIDGDLPLNRATIIGEGLPEHADQKAILELAGSKTTDGQLAEMIRMTRDTPKVSETQESLFGTEEASRSLIKEKAEVSDYIRKRLGQEKKLFAAVGSEGAAAKLAEAGNDIKAAQNASIAERTAQVQALYDKLSTSSGPVSDELNRAAALLANGEPSVRIKDEAYAAIKSGLLEQARRLAGEADRGQPETGAPGGRPATGSGKLDRPRRKLSEIIKDTSGEIRPGALARAIREGLHKPGNERRARRAASEQSALNLIEENRRVDEHNEAHGLDKWGRAPIRNAREEDAARNNNLFGAEDEEASRKAAEVHQNQITKDALTAQLRAPMSAEEQVRKLKAKRVVQEGLFDAAPAEKQHSLLDILNDTSGSFRPGFVREVVKATKDEITKGFDEMKALKAKRDAAMQALEKSKATPEDTRFGQKVIEAYTGERDLWEARVNQAIEKLRRIVPNHVDQEALALMRDFKHRPEELKQWLDKSHPSMDLMGQGDREAAERNIERLRPAIERAMDPTPAMEAADAVLTRISAATLKEGQRLGFLESRWTPDEYVPHILHPKGEGDVAKPIMDSVGRLLGGKIGRRFAFAETREFPSLLDAVANNYKPKTLNALDAFTIHGDKFATARATHILVKQLHETGVGIVGTDRTKIPEGFVAIAQHSQEFRHVVAESPEEKVQAFGGELTKPSETVRGSLYVPKVVDDALRPITDPDFQGKLWKRARNFQSYTKAVQLGISLFHATTENYMALSNMGPTGWARALASDRTSIPFLQGERDFIAHGGTTSIQGRTIEAYKSLQPGSIPRWSEIIRSAPGIRHADALASHINEFTFGKLQRQFKVTDYQMHKAAWMADHPQATAEETVAAAQSIAKEINAVYGGLHWENLGANKATTEILRGLMLAPDWTISNIFNVKYAMQNSPAGQLARRFWMRQIAGGLAATQLASLMFSGKPSKNLTQVYMGKDKEGKSVYQNIFFKGVSGDVINLVHNIADYGPLQGMARTLAGKAAPIPRAAMQLISNRDYMGHEISPKGMHWAASTARMATATAKTLAPVPLSAQNAWDMLLGPHAGKYSIPEVLTTPFSGNPPRHLSAKQDAEDKRPKRSIIEQFQTGKVYKTGASR